MDQTLGEIAQMLKDARAAKGLSQRELSHRAGVPQSHISKIERGGVDLRLSSLIAIARVLELEPMLVPRRSLPAVQSVVRSSSPPTRQQTTRPSHIEFQRLRRTIARLARANLFADFAEELARLQHQRRELDRLELSPADLAPLRAAHDALDAFKRTRDREDLRRAVAALRSRLDRRQYEAVFVVPDKPARAAYSLDEDDDHG